MSARTDIEAIEPKRIDRREFLLKAARGVGFALLTAVASEQVAEQVTERVARRDEESWAGDYAGV